MGKAMCLRAQSAVAHRRFQVTDTSDVVPGAAGGKHGTLAVCYLRHAFALGEHYNSVVPVEATSSDDGGEFEEVAAK